MTLEKAIKIARSSEVTDKNVQQLQQAFAPSLGRSTSTGAVRFRSDAADEDTVHRMGPVKRDTQAQKSTGAKGTNKPHCFRCDSVQHLANNCPLKDASCHNCGKRGHIARSVTSPSKTSCTSTACRRLLLLHARAMCPFFPQLWQDASFRGQRLAKCWTESQREQRGLFVPFTPVEFCACMSRFTAPMR